MKVLLISYGGSTLFEGAVDEFSMNDMESLVSVQARKMKDPAPARGSSSGSSLLNALAAASKSVTEAKVAEKKASYESEGVGKEDE